MRKLRNYMGGLGNNLFQYAFLYSKVRNGELPDIYLQDYRYFDNYKQELKDVLSEGIVPIDKVSLHVRRGDYVNNPYYVDLTQTDYYDKAIAEFPKEKFLVFCADRQDGIDDVLDQEWTMEWLKAKYGDRFELFDGFTEIHDFNAMAGCKGSIIANSSFSWWAAYVSPNSKKVVCPQKWFSSGKTIPVPEGWIKF